MNYQNIERYFSIVGDNGFCYTTSIPMIIEVIYNLRNATVMEMQSEEGARKYAICAYCSRFYLRNFRAGIPPMVPFNLPPNNAYYDLDFEKREGGVNGSYIPGLPI